MYIIELMKLLSDISGIDLIGTKDVLDTYPYAQISDVRTGDTLSMNGLDHIRGNAVIVGKFTSRLDSERWGEWFRQVLITTPLTLTGVTYIIRGVSVVTRPDITTQTTLWRTSLTIKFERTLGGTINE